MFKTSTNSINRFYGFKRNQDILELLFYLLSAVVLIYYVPAPINKILFLGLLPLAWTTKRDYLWLAFFFIVEDTPGGLFSGGLVGDPYRFPIYNIMPDVSFTIRELYLVLILVKGLYRPFSKHNLQKNYFKKELKLLGYYLLALIIFSTFMGMTLEGYRDVYKIFLNLTLFISVPLIFSNRYSFVKFLKIIFPFSIVALLFQLYSLTFGQQFIAVLKPGVTSVQGVVNKIGNEGDWLRPIEMVHVLLVSFTGSLFFLSKGKICFRPRYLITINLVSFLVIFLTGTRTWFLALIVCYLYYFLTRLQRISTVFIRYIFIISILLFGIGFVPALRNQIFIAWDRLSTLESFVEGDISAGGTVSRFDVRGPRVMEGFSESTILFGAGFSKQYYEYQDGHVGYHNILLNAGIIGMFLFANIFLKALFLPYSLSRSNLLSDHSKFELKASGLLLIGLLVINTGTQTLGYTPDGANRYFLMVLALTFINQAINSVTAYRTDQTTPFQNNTPSIKPVVEG